MKGLLFTYVLCYGGAIGSLVHPFIGLLVYICFAIIKPESMWYWSVPEGNYSRIVAIGLLLGWALRGFGNWRFFRARGIVLSLVLFWLWAILSATRAANQEAAWTAVESIAKIVLPFLVGITTVDSIRKLKLIAWVILLSEGYVALEFNLAYFSGWNRLWLDGFGGMDNNCNGIALVTCTGLAFFLGLHADRWWGKGLALAAAGLMIHAILFSFSRGAMVALVVSGAVAFLVLPKKPLYFFLLAAAIMVTLSLAGKEVRERFQEAFVESDQLDDSARTRLELWKRCWDYMKKEPLLGGGPDNWSNIVTQEYNWETGQQAHSLWLQTGAELGFPGLGFLVLFYTLTIVKLWPLTRDRYSVPDPWFRFLARMVITALIGFAFAAQFVSLKYLEVPFYIALVGAGVFKLCPRQRQAPTVLAEGPRLVPLVFDPQIHPGESIALDV